MVLVVTDVLVSPSSVVTVCDGFSFGFDGYFWHRSVDPLSFDPSTS